MLSENVIFMSYISIAEIESFAVDSKCPGNNIIKVL